jgi:hypothetical protein
MRVKKKQSESELRDISIALTIFNMLLVVIVISTVDDVVMHLRMQYLLVRMGIVMVLFLFVHLLIIRPRMNVKKLSRPAHKQGEYIWTVNAILLNAFVFFLTDIRPGEYFSLFLLIAFILGLFLLPLYLTVLKAERWRDRYKDQRQ